MFVAHRSRLRRSNVRVQTRLPGSLQGGAAEDGSVLIPLGASLLDHHPVVSRVDQNPAVCESVYNASSPDQSSTVVASLGSGACVNDLGAVEDLSLIHI